MLMIIHQRRSGLLVLLKKRLQIFCFCFITLPIVSSTFSVHSSFPTTTSIGSNSLCRTSTTSTTRTTVRQQQQQHYHHQQQRPPPPPPQQQQQEESRFIVHNKMSSSLSMSNSNSNTNNGWCMENEQHQKDAKSKLDIWPLDEYNTILLNEVHPREYDEITKQQQLEQEQHEVYDLIAIGAGAGGLVSSKQAARRGAKSCMISEYLAGGDCLNVGCVPSKALIRAARSIREVRRAMNEFGIQIIGSDDGPPSRQQQQQQQQQNIHVDFSIIMERLRRLRAKIAPADGHDGTTGTGAHVFQGRGRFVGNNEIEVEYCTTTTTTTNNGNHNHNHNNDNKDDHDPNKQSPTQRRTTRLQFKKAVIATGGRPSIPKNIPGLQDAPYTTNEILFNLQELPPRMVILGAGVIALEMAQTFATFGTNVTVIQRSERLFQSKGGDQEAGELLQTILENDGVTFVSGTTQQVTTLRQPSSSSSSSSSSKSSSLPLMSVQVATTKESNIVHFECECLLVATGRHPNVEDLGLEKANVQYEIGKGILVNDYAQSTSNPHVYAVGDCVAGVPRLTHMSGEMAKLIIQNSLFNDDWKLSTLIVPACMYTEPEYATVGWISSEEQAHQHGIPVDVYRTGLEHNDRAILESSNIGFCKIFTKHGTDEIVGATIVADRAGEMINEISLAIKNNIGLRAIGRNIHCYPTTGEAVMGCGIQFINSHWERLNQSMNE